MIMCHTSLSANPTKWSNTLKQFVGCVFDHFVGLVHKGLRLTSSLIRKNSSRLKLRFTAVYLGCKFKLLIYFVVLKKDICNMCSNYYLE